MNLPQEGTTQHVTFVLLLDIPSVTGFVNKCCGKKRVSSLTLYATFMKQTLLDIRNLNKNIIYTSVNKKKKHLETVSDFVAVKYRTGNL